MGLFNKFLKGLGFEDEEEKPEKIKAVKSKEKKDKLKPDFASFDLKNDSNLDLTKVEEKEQPKEEPKEQIFDTTTLLDIIKVNNQVEVQKVVDKLKNNEKVVVNMLALSQSDLTRSLDFLTGAVYALNKSMQKVDDAIFIIQ